MKKKGKDEEDKKAKEEKKPSNRGGYIREPYVGYIDRTCLGYIGTPCGGYIGIIYGGYIGELSGGYISRLCGGNKRRLCRENIEISCRGYFWKSWEESIEILLRGDIGIFCGWYNGKFCGEYNGASWRGYNGISLVEDIDVDDKWWSIRRQYLHIMLGYNGGPWGEEINSPNWDLIESHEEKILILSMEDKMVVSVE